MKTFLDSAVRDELLSRIDRLTPSLERRWGSMTVHGMVCHLCDSTRVALGLLRVAPLGNVLTHSRLFRFLAFAPLPWPHGLSTAPEIDQRLHGTPPATFAGDVRELKRLLDEFTHQQPLVGWPDHPILGAFTREDWGRQIYRHIDHHLKQFGV